ncbi:MAG TPA: hypothetical protein VKP58_13420 [Candidatus Acidoferrum sp.]|nr:hypothetical protein [Candidatus Acidoferrum sp.]
MTRTAGKNVRRKRLKSGTLRRRGRIAAGKIERDEAHFFVNETVRGEDHPAAESVRLAVKIGDFAAGFFDEEDAGRDVPALEAKFPEAIEPAGRDAGEIECGGTIAAYAVGTKREIVIIMNVGAGLALVHGKAGAKKACGKRGNFRDGDSFSVEGGAFAAGGGKEFFVDGIVNDAGEDFVLPSESDGDAEARIAVGEIGGAVERVDVPAIFGVVVVAKAFFGGDGVRGKIFREAIDDGAFAALVGLRDEVDVAFVFDLGGTGEFFAKNFAGFEGGIDGDFEKGFWGFRQTKLL